MKVSGRLKIIDKNGVKFSQKGRIKYPDIIEAQSVDAERDISFDILSGTTAKLCGKIKGGDIDIKHLVINGSIKTTSITSDDCMMQLSQRNNIDKIVGRNVDVRVAKTRSPEIFTSIFSSFCSKNVTENMADGDKINIGEIIANTVSLEYCSVNKIICDSIVLREQCKIKELVYEGELDFDETIKIERIINESEEK